MHYGYGSLHTDAEVYVSLRFEFFFVFFFKIWGFKVRYLHL